MPYFVVTCASNKSVHLSKFDTNSESTWYALGLDQNEFIDITYIFSLQKHSFLKSMA